MQIENEFKHEGRATALIPARLDSVRLPNKALMDIQGLPMIVHVYKRLLYSKLLSEIFVVTDSSEINEIVVKHGGKCIYKKAKHECGTNRIAEVAKDISSDIIVNVQGDEALVNPCCVDKAIETLRKDNSIKVGILVNSFKKWNSRSDIKVVMDKFNYILYLSRKDIPSCSRKKIDHINKAYHIVPFRKEFLLHYANLPKSPLEIIENNEYLRILENGYKLKAIIVDSDAISVDTQEDYMIVNKLMPKDKYFKRYHT